MGPGEKRSDAVPELSKLAFVGPFSRMLAHLATDTSWNEACTFGQRSQGSGSIRVGCAGQSWPPGSTRWRSNHAGDGQWFQA